MNRKLQCSLRTGGGVCSVVFPGISTILSLTKVKNEYAKTVTQVMKLSDDNETVSLQKKPDRKCRFHPNYCSSSAR